MKLVFFSSTITMMHGPINTKFSSMFGFPIQILDYISCFSFLTHVSWKSDQSVFRDYQRMTVYTSLY